MSDQEVNRFIKQYGQDRAFRETVARRIHGKTGAAVAESISRIARQYAYHFTPEEYLAARNRAVAFDDEDLRDTRPAPSAGIRFWHKLRNWLKQGEA